MKDQNRYGNSEVAIIAVGPMEIPQITLALSLLKLL